MSRPNIHDEYFSWLYHQVSGRRSYVDLCSYLHNNWEFYWSVPYDENRQADGYDQRDTFVQFVGSQVFLRREIQDLMNAPVSVFEVLVAIVNRMDFNLDDLVSGPRRDKWFAELLENLDLADLTDDVFIDQDRYDHQKRIDHIMRILLDRTYDEDGTGSLFPLKHADKDMRTVELWYQMMAYLNERHPI